MNNKTCGECKHCENKQVIATCEHVGITTGRIQKVDAKGVVVVVEKAMRKARVEFDDIKVILG